MENKEEILAVLRSLEGKVNNIDQRAGGGPMGVPAELRAGSTADPTTRAKILDEYTSKLFDQPSSTWTKDQQILVREQIKTVLKTL